MRKWGIWLQIIAVCIILLLPPTRVVSGETSINWDTNADFAQGILLNLTISGSGSSALLTMKMVDAWAQANFSFQPAARQGTGLTSTPLGFVMFGGNNGNLFFNDTWVFVNGEWIKKEGINAPPPRAFAAISYSLSDRMIYLFGGRNGTTIFDDIWAYNLTADIWTKITASPSPSRRYGATLTYHNSTGKLLLFGGNNSTLLNDLWEFDPFTKTWLNRNPIGVPSARFFHAAAYASINAKLYLFGGLSTTTALSDFYEYNYTSNRWTLLTSQPQGRYGHVLAYLSESLILAGGTNGTAILGDTWRYSLSGGGWQQLSLSSSLFPVAFSGYAASQSHLMSVGGLGPTEQAINQFFPSYTTGIFTTQSVDTQRQGSTNFYIKWNPPVQEHGYIKCQVALNNDNANWNFVGPDGTPNSFYENGYGQPVSGTARYIRIRVYFIPENGIFSPCLDSLSLSFNRPPDKPTPKTPSGILKNSMLTFTWQFNDLDNDYQSAFRIQVSQNPNFNPIFLDTGVIQSSAQLWINSSIPDGTFYWRIATMDSEGLWSVYSDPLGFTIDTIPPFGTITINSGSDYTTTQGVILSLTYTDTGVGVGRMRFSNNGYTWSPWETPVSQKAWTLDAGDGSKYVYMMLEDIAGNSFVCSDVIVLDTAPPMGTLTINNDTEYTNTESVWLQVSATDATSGVDAVRFSNDGNTWSNWQSLSSNVAWTLTPGDGLKQVYAQVRDKSGHTVTCSDTIYLDKSPPPAPAFYPEPRYTSGYANTVSWHAVTDSISGGVSYNVECSNTPTFSWVTSSGWIYSTSYTFSGLSVGYTYYYRVRARDMLGNVGPYSTVVNSTQDASGPVITQIAPSPPAYFNPQNIVLSWRAVDHISGLSGLYHIQISTDENFLVSSVDTYITGSTSNLDTVYHAPLLPDGKYYWRVQAEDNAGNWGQYSQITYFEVDSFAPKIICNQYIYGWYSKSPGSVIDVDFYSDGQAPIVLARWKKANGDWHVIFEGAFSAYTQNWAVNWDEMEEGSNQILIELQDAAGNKENAVVYFLRDSVAPYAIARVNGIEGQNEWYVSVVHVEITSSDGVSGISRTVYRIFDGLIWSQEQEYFAAIELNLSGSYTIEYYCEDNAGNLGERQTIEIRLDLEFPTTTSNASNGWYSNLPIVINLRSRDKHSGVLGIYYSLDGSNYTFVYGPEVDLKINTEGIHTIAFFAVDMAGNREIEKRVEVKVDTTSPSTELSWIHDDTNATISIISKDQISGVYQTFFWVFNNSTGTPLLMLSGVYNSSFNLTEGIWLFSFYSVDAAGNQEAVQNRTLILDWHEPAVEIYLNSNSTTTNTTNILISIRAMDNVGIAGISFSADGYNWSTIEEFSENKTWILEDVEEWHSVYCKVIDIAGNTNITKKSIYLDTESPTIYEFFVEPLLAGNSRVLLKWYVSEQVRATLAFSPDGENFEVIARNISTTEIPWLVPPVDSENCILKLDVWDIANNHAEKCSNLFAIDSLCPDVESFSPEIAEPSAWIEIKFTEDMNKESVERSFVIQPYISGKFYWLDNRTMIFVPDGKFEEGGNYRVIVTCEAEDVAGNHISQRIFYFNVKSYLPMYLLVLGILIVVLVGCGYLVRKRRKKRKAMVF